MLGGRYLPKHERIIMLSLFLVTVHDLKLHYALVISINNKQLPNDVISRQGLIVNGECACTNMFVKVRHIYK